MCFGGGCYLPPVDPVERAELEDEIVRSNSVDFLVDELCAILQKMKQTHTRDDLDLLYLWQRVMQDTRNCTLSTILDADATCVACGVLIPVGSRCFVRSAVVQKWSGKYTYSKAHVAQYYCSACKPVEASP